MLGIVKGSTIHSKHIGKDISQAFKTLVGGELTAYNEMMNEARAIATKRMVAEAEAMDADAIVNIRYASAAVMQGAAEVIAYKKTPGRKSGGLFCFMNQISGISKPQRFPAGSN